VLFLYHPFGRHLVQRLRERVDLSLLAHPRDFYIVYINPVWAEVFDRSEILERRYAAQLTYDAGELGYGPDGSDGVVVWQNCGNRHPRPQGAADAPVIAVKPGHRARVDEVETATS
jgi:hypothetical protein